MAILGGTYIKVPGAILAATLTGFVHKIDLADLSDSFWNNVDAAGAYVRVKDSGGTDLPFDLLSIDTGTKTGTLLFRGTVTAGQTNEYRIVADDAATAPAVTDPLGRNAVYADYDCFFVGSAPLVNRTGAATTQAALTAGSTSTYGWLPFSSPVNSHQGVAYDGTYFYVMDTNRIRKYDSQWRIILENSNPLAAARTASGYTNLDHVGDGTVKDGELFLMLEEYPNSPYDTQIVGVYNLSDLSLNRIYDISAQGHEVSSICWDATNSYFVVTDYTTAGNTVLHKYSSTFSYLGTITVSSLTQKQGIEYYDGKFYMIGTSRIFSRCDLDGSNLTTLSVAGGASGQEGLCSLGDGTFAVLFDGSPSALMRAVPNTMLATMYPHALNTLNTAPFRCSGLPKRTTWTMGASIIPLLNSASTHGSFLSYSDNSTSSSNRATFALENHSKPIAAWNSTDSWLRATDSPRYWPSNYAVIGRRLRAVNTFNGTTDRKIYVQGDQDAIDVGTSQRPAGTGDTLFVGVEDSSPGERFYGLMNYIYLRDGELSADWLKAEYRSWDEKSFYSTSDVSDADADYAALDFTFGSDTDPGAGATGWTKYLANDYDTSARGSGISGPAFGSRFFRSDAGGHAFGYQDVNVAAHASRIDHGDVTAVLSGSMNSDNADGDAGYFYLEFRDGSSNLLKRVETRMDHLPNTSTWNAKTINCPVPRGTRSIRRGFVSERQASGTDINIAWDIEYTKLVAPVVGTPPVVEGRGRRQILVH